MNTPYFLVNSWTLHFVKPVALNVRSIHGRFKNQSRHLYRIHFRGDAVERSGRKTLNRGLISEDPTWLLLTAQLGAMNGRLVDRKIAKLDTLHICFVLAVTMKYVVRYLIVSIATPLIDILISLFPSIESRMTGQRIRFKTKSRKPSYRGRIPRSLC